MTIEVDERDLIQVLNCYASEPDEKGNVFYRCPSVYYYEGEMRLKDIYSSKKIEKGYYFPSFSDKFMFVKSGDTYKSKQVSIMRIGRRVK